MIPLHGNYAKNNIDSVLFMNSSGGKAIFRRKNPPPHWGSNPLTMRAEVGGYRYLHRTFLNKLPLVYFEWTLDVKMHTFQNKSHTVITFQWKWVKQTYYTLFNNYTGFRKITSWNKMKPEMLIKSLEINIREWRHANCLLVKQTSNTETRHMN